MDKDVNGSRRKDTRMTCWSLTPGHRAPVVSSNNEGSNDGKDPKLSKVPIVEKQTNKHDLELF